MVPLGVKSLTLFRQNKILHFAKNGHTFWSILLRKIQFRTFMISLVKLNCAVKAKFSAAKMMRLKVWLDDSLGCVCG